MEEEDFFEENFVNRLVEMAKQDIGEFVEKFMEALRVKK